MRTLLSNQKRTIIATVLIIVMLLGTNLLLSIFLRVNYSDALDSCTGNSSLIHFHPTLNESGSFVNLKLNIAYCKPLFLVLTIVGILFSLLCFAYFLYLKQIYNTKGWVVFPTAFMITACLGRFIERILWEYSFDFIAIKRIAILDVLDVYILLACVGLVIAAIHFQLCENNATKGLSKAEKRQYNMRLHKDFLKLWSRKR